MACTKADWGEEASHFVGDNPCPRLHGRLQRRTRCGVREMSLSALFLGSPCSVVLKLRLAREKADKALLSEVRELSRFLESCMKRSTERFIIAGKWVTSNGLSHLAHTTHTASQPAQPGRWWVRFWRGENEGEPELRIRNAGVGSTPRSRTPTSSFPGLDSASSAAFQAAWSSRSGRHPVDKPQGSSDLHRKTSRRPATKPATYALTARMLENVLSGRLTWAAGGSQLVRRRCRDLLSRSRPLCDARDRGIQVEAQLGHDPLIISLKPG
jgi:hypothetical protein